MFQYEIHNLKSGKVFYRHIFVDKDYQITITRAAITREQLRTFCVYEQYAKQEL